MELVLKFADDEQSKDRFRFLYQGLVMSQKAQQPRPLEILRREAAVLSKLEAISELDAGPIPGLMALRPEGVGTRELVLTRPEVDLLKEYLPAVA